MGPKDKMILVVDGTRGIYGPSVFAERFADYLTKVERSYLECPYDAHYWDTWNDIVRDFSLTIEGDRWVIHEEEGNIFLVNTTSKEAT